MSCPWDGFSPANLAFCEAPRCAWLVEPANTVSNLGFLIVGVAVWLRSRRDGRPLAGALGWIAALTGLGSAAFHATGTWAGQFLDQSAMFLESAFFVTFSVWRWRGWSRGGLAALYLGLSLGAMGLMAIFPTTGIGLFAGQIALFLALEAGLYRRDGSAVRRGPMVGAGLTFALAWTVWWLDHLGIWCDPHNHIFSGHALWHWLGALSFGFWYAHFAQFEANRRDSFLGR